MLVSKTLVKPKITMSDSGPYFMTRPYIFPYFQKRMACTILSEAGYCVLICMLRPNETDFFSLFVICLSDNFPVRAGLRWNENNLFLNDLVTRLKVFIKMK